MIIQPETPREAAYALAGIYVWEGKGEDPTAPDQTPPVETSETEPPAPAAPQEASGGPEESGVEHTAPF